MGALGRFSKGSGGSRGAPGSPLVASASLLEASKILLHTPGSLPESKAIGGCWLVGSLPSVFLPSDVTNEA